LKVYRTNNPTLGCSFVTGPERTVFHDTRLEEPLYITQDPFIRYPVTEKFHQPLLIHIIQ